MRLKISWESNEDGKAAWLVATEDVVVYVEPEYGANETSIGIPDVYAEVRRALGDPKPLDVDQVSGKKDKPHYFTVSSLGFVPYRVLIRYDGADEEKLARPARGEFIVVPSRSRTVALTLSVMAAVLLVPLAMFYLQLPPSHSWDVAKVLGPFFSVLWLAALQVVRSDRRLPWFGILHDARRGAGLLVLAILLLVFVPKFLLTGVVNATGVAVKLQTTEGEPEHSLEPRTRLVLLLAKDDLKGMLSPEDQATHCFGDEEECDLKNARIGKSFLERLTLLKMRYITCLKRQVEVLGVEPLKRREEPGAPCSKDPQVLPFDGRKLLHALGHGLERPDVKLLESTAEITVSPQIPEGVNQAASVGKSSAEDNRLDRFVLLHSSAKQPLLSARMESPKYVRSVLAKLGDEGTTLTPVRVGDLAGLRIEMQVDEQGTPTRVGALHCGTTLARPRVELEEVEVKPRLARLTMSRRGVVLSDWQADRPEDRYPLFVCRESAPEESAAGARGSPEGADLGVLTLGKGFYPDAAGSTLHFPKGAAPKLLDIYLGEGGHWGQLECLTDELTHKGSVDVTVVPLVDLDLALEIESVTLISQTGAPSWKSIWRPDAEERSKRGWAWMCSPGDSILGEVPAVIQGRRREIGPQYGKLQGQQIVRQLKPGPKCYFNKNDSPPSPLKHEGRGCEEATAQWLDEQRDVMATRGCGKIFSCDGP